MLACGLLAPAALCAARHQDAPLLRPAQARRQRQRAAGLRAPGCAGGAAPSAAPCLEAAACRPPGSACAVPAITLCPLSLSCRRPARPAQAAPRLRATGTGAATRACSAMSTGARPRPPARTTGSALLLSAGPAELAQGLPAAPVTCVGTARRMPAAAAALAPRAPRQGRNTGHRPAARRPRRRAGSARARRKKDMVSAAVQAKARREQGGAGAARGAKCAAKGARAPGERPPPVMQLLGESACSGSRCARVGCGGPLAVSAHLPAAEQHPRHAGCLSVCALRPAGSLSGTLAVGTLCLAPDEPTAGPLLTRACGARRRAEARARRVRRGRLTGFLAG